MVYQRYLKNFIFSCFVCCLIFLLAVCYQIGADTKISSFYYGMDKIKLDFANSINTPKLVITSGSNSLYGISSKIITDETGITTVNSAIYIGFGIDYILHRAKLILKPGDTVLLPLEYDLYFPNALPDKEGLNSLIDYTFAHDPAYLLNHPWLIVKMPFGRLMNGIFAKHHPYPPTDLSPWIGKSGDALGNREADITQKERAELNRQGPIQVTKLKFDAYEFRVIKNFAQWCHKNKIRLLATWPNTMWFDVYNQPIYQDFFRDIEKFYKSIGVPVLGTYKDFMYDKSLFFNTIYHLNHKGVRIRSHQLMTLLKSFFQEMGTPNKNNDSSQAAVFQLRPKRFGQEIKLLDQLKNMKVNETIKLPIMVKNVSNFDWDAKEINPINFSYRWIDNNGKVIVFDGERTLLPERLTPQKSTQLNAVIKSPNRPGNYNLILTMVEEYTAWFNDKGAQPLKIPVIVTP
ncbi:hypothetical protein BZZ01_22215 [Nostocales cyanobacterium HT-58-2]|nr:hypothetical protein BZZ01_22215 [Nostocales cyanobacterium HT-58-2]